MNPTIEFLKGKKTYFTCAIAGLYLVGCWLGFYQLDEKILTVLGITGLAFLRAGMGKAGN